MVTKSAFDKGISDLKADMVDIKEKVEATNRLLTMFIEDKNDS